MTEYGIWAALEGCFIDAQYWTRADAETERGRLLREEAYYEPADLTVREICPDHEEQPRDTCEDCTAGEATCPDHEDQPLEDCQRCALADAA